MNKELIKDLVLMVDIFAACIKSETFPAHGSPCHRKVRELVDKSGFRPERKRRRMPRKTERAR